MKDVFKAGIEVMHTKKMGDAGILITYLDDEAELVSQTARILKLLQENHEKYNKIIRIVYKNMSDEEGLKIFPASKVSGHLSVFAIDSYSLANLKDNKSLASIQELKSELDVDYEPERSSDDDVDFVSSYMNHFMKYGEKAAAGCIALFADSLRLNKVLSELRVHSSSKGKEQGNRSDLSPMGQISKSDLVSRKILVTRKMLITLIEKKRELAEEITLSSLKKDLKEDSSYQYAKNHELLIINLKKIPDTSK